MGNKYLLPRAILGIMSLYHVIVGLALNSPPNSVKWVAQHWFSVNQLPGEPSIHIARMLGVYMVAFGAALGAAAWNPVKNRTILTLGVLLAMTRIMQRFFTAGQLEASLGIPQSHNFALIAPLAVFTAVLVVFRWRIYRQMKSAPSHLA